MLNVLFFNKNKMKKNVSIALAVAVVLVGGIYLSDMFTSGAEGNLKNVRMESVKKQSDAYRAPSTKGMVVKPVSRNGSNQEEYGRGQGGESHNVGYDINGDGRVDENDVVSNQEGWSADQSVCIGLARNLRNLCTNAAAQVVDPDQRSDALDACLDAYNDRMEACGA